MDLIVSQSCKVIRLAVQIDDLFVSPFPRPVQLYRHFANFQQSRDLFTTSIQSARIKFPWFLLTVQNDALIVSPLQRAVQIHRHIGNFP